MNSLIEIQDSLVTDLQQAAETQGLIGAAGVLLLPAAANPLASWRENLLIHPSLVMIGDIVLIYDEEFGWENLAAVMTAKLMKMVRTGLDNGINGPEGLMEGENSYAGGRITHRTFTSQPGLFIIAAIGSNQPQQNDLLLAQLFTRLDQYFPQF